MTTPLPECLRELVEIHCGRSYPGVFVARHENEKLRAIALLRAGLAYYLHLGDVDPKEYELAGKIERWALGEEGEK